jgi:hypothetical protein
MLTSLGQRIPGDLRPRLVIVALLTLQHDVALLRASNSVSRSHNSFRRLTKAEESSAALTRGTTIMNTTSLRGWWLHGVVLAIVIFSEYIGILRLPIGIGTVIFLPILYAFALGHRTQPSYLETNRSAYSSERCETG